MRVDTILVGQGIAGSLLAWYLHRAGQKLAVFDQANDSSASLVAGGIVNPVAGQRLVKLELADEYLAEALDCFSKMENSYAANFITAIPFLRLFASTDEKQLYEMRAKEVSYAGFLTQAREKYEELKIEESRFDSSYGSVLQLNTHTVDTTKWLSGCRHFLQAQHLYMNETFHHDSLSLDQGVTVGELQADRIVFCEGMAGGSNPWFDCVPYSFSKGELLTVRSSKPLTNCIVSKGMWLLPLAENHYKLGATYEWEYETREPTNVNRQRLLEGMESLFNKSYLNNATIEVVKHEAGVRPGVQDRMPVLGMAPDNSRLFIFNGLGSKGLLWGPYYARMLTEFITKGKPVAASVDVQRFAKMPVIDGRTLVEKAHTIVAAVIEQGDAVVDATLGNGFDSAFLASCVGPKGKVYAFDVQNQAIEVSARLLEEKKLADRVILLQQSHETMCRELSQRGEKAIKAAMFNLGYRPGSDKTVTTHFTTTRIALEQALDLLAPGGVITILAYTGHAGGQREAQQVLDWLELIDRSIFSVTFVNADIPNQRAPILIAVHKKS
jgi:glycine/D-amino acid oxidase-like deaminating enzyme